MDIQRKPKIIVKEIERLISLNLDDRASTFIAKHYHTLSIRSIRHIMKYMYDTGHHPYGVWHTICINSTAQYIDNNLLRAACVYGNLELVRFCLTNNTNLTISFGFLKACEYNHISIVRLLLEDDRITEHDPITEYELIFGLIEACNKGHTEIVKLLLSDERCDPSANSSTAFHSACANNHSDIVKLLLCDPRIDPSLNKSKGFVSACIDNCTDVVKLLMLDERIDPSAYGNTALYDATRHRCRDTVKLLLKDSRVLRSGSLYIASIIARDRKYDDIADLISMAIVKGAEDRGICL